MRETSTKHCKSGVSDEWVIPRPAGCLATASEVPIDESPEADKACRVHPFLRFGPYITPGNISSSVLITKQNRSRHVTTSDDSAVGAKPGDDDRNSRHPVCQLASNANDLSIANNLALSLLMSNRSNVSRDANLDIEGGNQIRGGDAALAPRRRNVSSAANGSATSAAGQRQSSRPKAISNRQKSSRSCATSGGRINLGGVQDPIIKNEDAGRCVAAIDNALNDDEERRRWVISSGILVDLKVEGNEDDGVLSVKEYPLPFKMKSRDLTELSWSRKGADTLKKNSDVYEGSVSSSAAHTTVPPIFKSGTDETPSTTGNRYAAITLPFYSRGGIKPGGRGGADGREVTNPECSAIKDEAAPGGTQRPHLDESRLADALCKVSADKMGPLVYGNVSGEMRSPVGNTSLILIQLPPALPAMNMQKVVDVNLSDAARGCDAVSEKETDSYVGTNFRHVPEGKIGKLKVKQSGKVQLILEKAPGETKGGECQNEKSAAFEVLSGSDCGFASEAGCLVGIGPSKELLLLGEIQHRAVVSFDCKGSLAGR